MSEFKYKFKVGSDCLVTLAGSAEGALIVIARRNRPAMMRFYGPNEYDGEMTEQKAREMAQVAISETDDYEEK